MTQDATVETTYELTPQQVKDWEARRALNDWADTLPADAARMLAGKGQPSAVELRLPKPKKTADLTEHAKLLKRYDKLTDAINLAQAEQKQIREEITALMGEAEQATVNGVPVFTHNWKNAYRKADFVKTYPELVEQYKVVRQVEEIDWDKLIAHHKDSILAPFQSREFRRAQGIQSL